MKILLHSLNYTPELTGIGKYSGEMAAWLSAQGHEVRVVSAPPYYPQWRVAQGYGAGRYQTEVLAGVQVTRCPVWVPAQPSGLKRLVHLASFALASLPVMLRQAFWRPDVVWVVAPALFCAPGAWLAARLGGAPVWLHVQDFEVDAAFDLGLLKGQGMKRAVLACERWLLRRFDRVSTLSGRMHQRLLDKGVAPKQAVLFPNWVDVSGIHPDRAGGSYRQELGLPPDAVVALYSGNMGAKQGLEVLAALARLLADHPTLRFVFCGQGAGRAELEAACAGLPHVIFLDLQPLERLGDLLTLADIHLLPQRADAADLVMPSKLTGMLASGRPVVATAHPQTEVARVVQGCGRVVPPGQPEALAQAVAALAADAPLRQQLGDAARRYAQDHLDQDAVLRRFEADLQALCSERIPT